VVALGPDVIIATGSPSVAELQQVTRDIPIVFVNVADPVTAGFVESLARPGGNITGYTPYEYGIGAKWLELLKEVAPTTTRVAFIRDPSNPAALGQFGAIQSVAPSLRIDLSLINMRDAANIENAVAAFARLPNGGLILTGSALPQAKPACCRQRLWLGSFAGLAGRDQGDRAAYPGVRQIQAR
jgi:putative ABC transport system substrate-binding protein